jgi:uncharacterized protein YigA (DUF484 family)
MNPRERPNDAQKTSQEALSRLIRALRETAQVIAAQSHSPACDATHQAHARAIEAEIGYLEIFSQEFRFVANQTLQVIQKDAHAQEKQKLQAAHAEQEKTGSAAPQEIADQAGEIQRP